MTDKGRPNRRSVRLKACDYAHPGAYFVTMCVADRRCLFGTVAERNVYLSRFGAVAEAEWHRTAELRPNVELGEHIVMPNHIHGVIFLVDDDASAGEPVPEPRRAVGTPFGKPQPGCLASIVRAFKGAVTRQVNAMRRSPGRSVWQPNYYEHIVRSPEELDRISYYIRTNPQRWDRDSENPSARIVDDDWPFDDGGMSAWPPQPAGP